MANIPPPTQTPQVICAPARPPITFPQSVFLAGTTSSFSSSSSSSSPPDWRSVVVASLSDLPVTIFDPVRLDWDSSWQEHSTFAPFREQVEWELEMQERADVVVVYFGSATDAPVSLLEFGLSARSGRAVVACEAGYRKRGNVEIVCRRYGVEMVDDVGGLGAVVRRLVDEGRMG